MESYQFDLLAQTLSSSGVCRRQVARTLVGALLGGAFAGVAARLGLTGSSAKQKHTSRKHAHHPSHHPASRHRHPKDVHSQGKGKKHHKKRKNPQSPPSSPPPPLPPGCQSCNECQMCQDGACVADPDLNGVRCLGSGASCGYCAGGQCAAASVPPCPDGTCPQAGQCCPGEQRCPDPAPESPTGFACVGWTTAAPTRSGAPVAASTSRPAAPRSARRTAASAVRSASTGRGNARRRDRAAMGRAWLTTSAVMGRSPAPAAGVCRGASAAPARGSAATPASRWMCAVPKTLPRAAIIRKNKSTVVTGRESAGTSGIRRPATRTAIGWSTTAQPAPVSARPVASRCTPTYPGVARPITRTMPWAQCASAMSITGATLSAPSGATSAGLVPINAAGRLNESVGVAEIRVKHLPDLRPPQHLSPVILTSPAGNPNRRRCRLRPRRPVSHSGGRRPPPLSGHRRCPASQRAGDHSSAAPGRPPPRSSAPCR